MFQVPSRELLDLALAHGVQVEYRDMAGRVKLASSRSLLAVLGALGVGLPDESFAAKALGLRRLKSWSRRVDPVIVAWDKPTSAITVRLPASLSPSRISCLVEGEQGPPQGWAISSVECRNGDPIEIDGGHFIPIALKLPIDLSIGYHKLSLTFEDGQRRDSLVIVAPTRAYEGVGGAGKRTWGVFCPLYALHRAKSWGAGDFSDLEALIDWTSSLGGGLVATLPMLASSFDGPSPTISPYSPTSRLFWNEFYLDVERIPELEHCEAARSLLASDETSREVDSLRKQGLVNYGRQMRLKRAVLEELADWFFAHDSGRKDAFRAYVTRHPLVESYARFQAAGERYGRDWRYWPESIGKSGESAGWEIDRRSIHYHLYAQWQAEEQLQRLVSKAGEKGLTWYLDYPVGVDFNSFDVWTHRDDFAIGASVGCPPDPVFTRGQNWGFPPIHPDRQRESGYAYLIASIRNHLRFANALRIDHVMGLHRLFWIPEGAEAKDGAFVSTPAEEIYAILSVESHRHSAWLVGEDLGTVPPEVDGAMKRHGVRGMYVVQYEIRPEPEPALREVPRSTVASVNTHDMPPFATFWGGLDLDDRRDLGLLDGEGLEAERLVRRRQREGLVKSLQAEGLLAPDRLETDDVLHALWNWLAASGSGVVLLNLEDLWLETEPQNTPNTYDERPNWRRKARRSFEEFSSEPEFIDILKKVDKYRSI